MIKKFSKYIKYLENNLVKVMGILVIVMILLSVYLYLSLRGELQQLRCDVKDSVFAERRYTYPILRTIDDPDNYAKEILNPVTHKDEYYKDCDYYEK